MLLSVLESLARSGPALRAVIAAAIALLLVVLPGSRAIAWMRKRFSEPVLSDSPQIVQWRESKAATPTLGGLLILAAIAITLVLVADLTNRYVQAALLVAGGLGIVGLVDDVTKLRSRAHGISPRAKLCGQIIVALLAAGIVYRQQSTIGVEWPPRLDLAGASLWLGPWFLLLAVLVITGASNAVNLTDGLDGLAGGCLVAAIVAMGMADYMAGDALWSARLGIPFIPGASEMAVVAAATLGSVLGFLHFNRHPAQVFMGDTGSLPLGGLLGLLAIVARQEFLLVLVGGVFVAEAASVILQVGSFKLRKQRVFRCAPLHHHFQFLGWTENRIVTRFWIASVLCALAGFGLLIYR